MDLLWERQEMYQEMILEIIETYQKPEDEKWKKEIKENLKKLEEILIETSEDNNETIKRVNHGKS